GGRFALTAGHCVDSGATPAKCRVFAGISTRADTLAIAANPIKRILIHPEYVLDLAHANTMRDITILELATDVIAPLAKPIRYATAADVRAGLTNPGVACMASGWGW